MAGRVGLQRRGLRGVVWEASWRKVGLERSEGRRQTGTNSPVEALQVGAPDPHLRPFLQALGLRRVCRSHHHHQVALLVPRSD